MTKTADTAPLDALGEPIDPDALYVCVDSYATDSFQHGFVATRGMKLKGTHPAVTTNGLFWAREGNDDLTLTGARQRLTRVSAEEE